MSVFFTFLPSLTFAMFVLSRICLTCPPLTLSCLLLCAPSVTCLSCVRRSYHRDFLLAWYFAPEILRPLFILSCFVEGLNSFLFAFLFFVWMLMICSGDV